MWDRQIDDMGSLAGDLFQFLNMISDIISASEGRKLAQAGISAVSSGDEMVKSAIREL